jgi:hypothetical protein
MTVPDCGGIFPGVEVRDSAWRHFPWISPDDSTPEDELVQGEKIKPPGGGFFLLLPYKFRIPSSRSNHANFV